MVSTIIVCKTKTLLNPVTKYYLFNLRDIFSEFYIRTSVLERFLSSLIYYCVHPFKGGVIKYLIAKALTAIGL
jgi:hypothetical protein